MAPVHPIKENSAGALDFRPSVMGRDSKRADISSTKVRYEAAVELTATEESTMSSAARWLDSVELAIDASQPKRDLSDVSPGSLITHDRITAEVVSAPKKESSSCVATMPSAQTMPSDHSLDHVHQRRISPVAESSAPSPLPAAKSEPPTHSGGGWARWCFGGAPVTNGSRASGSASASDAPPRGLRRSRTMLAAGFAKVESSARRAAMIDDGSQKLKAQFGAGEFTSASLDPQQLDLMRRTFAIFDQDCKGTIDKGELMDVRRASQLSHLHRGPPLRCLG